MLGRGPLSCEYSNEVQQRSRRRPRQRGPEVAQAPAAHPARVEAETHRGRVAEHGRARSARCRRRPTWGAGSERGVVVVQPVISDAVREVEYDPATRTMRVVFRDGGVYDYFDIDPALHREMLTPHPWRRVGLRVKGHRCRRVTG